MSKVKLTAKTGASGNIVGMLKTNALGLRV